MASPPSDRASYGHYPSLMTDNKSDQYGANGASDARNADACRVKES